METGQVMPKVRGSSDARRRASIRRFKDAPDIRRIGEIPSSAHDARASAVSVFTMIELPFRLRANGTVMGTRGIVDAERLGDRKRRENMGCIEVTELQLVSDVRPGDLPHQVERKPLSAASPDRPQR